MEFKSTDPRVPVAHEIAVNLVREIIESIREGGRRVPYTQEYLDDVERSEGRLLIDERSNYETMWNFPLCRHSRVWRDLCQLNGINAFAATNLGWLHNPEGPEGPGWTCPTCQHQNQEAVLFCFSCHAASPQETDLLGSTETLSALWLFYGRDIGVVAAKYSLDLDTVQIHLQRAGLI